MPTFSNARLRRVEKILAADLDATRKVARLEKIAADEGQHPARRARAYDAIWKIWAAAARTAPHKATEFQERARLAAVKAEELRPKPSEIIVARLAEMGSLQPVAGDAFDAGTASMRREVAEASGLRREVLARLLRLRIAHREDAILP